MAFFDKISSLAKNVGDATNDALENTKLNGKIKAEEGKIAAQKSRLGNLYYEHLTAGRAIDAEVAEVLGLIAQSEAEIDAARAEIEANRAGAEARKAENEARRAEEAAARAAAAPSPSQSSVTVCGCGTANPAGTKFCTGCGTQLVADAPTCPGCGATVNAGSRFCSVCGNPLA